MKLHAYNKSPAYRKWVLARDKALEQFHIRAQLEATDVMRHILTEVLLAAKGQFHALKSHQNIDHLEWHIRSIMRAGTKDLDAVYNRLRIRSYLLAKSSQVEIISRLNKSATKGIKVTGHELRDVMAGAVLAGGFSAQRIGLYLDRLARKIINAAQSASLSKDTDEDFLLAIYWTFPKMNVYRRPPRVLKPKLMTEAANPIAGIHAGVPDWQATYDQARDEGATSAEATMLLDAESEAAWQDLLDAYRNEYVPVWRAPEYVIDIPVTDPTVQVTTGEQVWYAWEFERDLTNQFVADVRDGEITAANESGITDFVWIAVVDAVTDACCLWRDGLLVSEIEDKLDEHQDEDGECNIDSDGLVPPLHFNCRCTLAPATADIPDKPDTGLAEFEDWLST